MADDCCETSNVEVMYLSMPGPGAMAEPFAFISARYMTKLAPFAREITCAVKEFFLQIHAQLAELPPQSPQSS